MTFSGHDDSTINIVLGLLLLLLCHLFLATAVVLHKTVYPLILHHASICRSHELRSAGATVATSVVECGN